MDLRRGDWDWVDLGNGVVRLFSYLPEEETIFDDIISEYMEIRNIVDHDIHFVNWGCTMDGYSFIDIETTPMK